MLKNSINSLKTALFSVNEMVAMATIFEGDRLEIDTNNWHFWKIQKILLKMEWFLAGPLSGPFLDPQTLD